MYTRRTWLFRLSGGRFGASSAKETRPHALADGDDPNGNCEYEPAKRLTSRRGRLPEADGQVVRIVAQLLPKPRQLRIVFMGRDLDEAAMAAVVDPRLHRQRGGRQATTA